MLRATLSLALLLALTVDAAAQALPPPTHQAPTRHWAVYAGFSTIPVAISGLADLHVSDWEKCGLGAGGVCPEGRVGLPLADGNTALPMAFGPKIGVGLRFNRVVFGFAEVGVHFAGPLVVTAAIGADFYLVGLGNFRAGLAPRIGFIAASMDFGATDQLPGYQAPVITPEGEFDNGDRLSAVLAGFMLGAGAVAELDITPTISVRAEVGFQYAFFGDLTIQVNADDPVSIEINKDSPALVKPDGSSTHVGIDPSAASLGVAGFLGVVFRF